MPTAFSRFFAVLSLSLVASCFGNSTTSFPPGLAPWDPENLATAPGMGSSFPEELSFSRQQFFHEGAARRIPSMHARAFIQRPLSEVWVAARDPQWGRDPTASHGFRILAYNTDMTVDYSWRTHHLVNSIQTLEWDVDWRMGLVEGTSTAPTVVAIRWQKTSGSTALNVIEGSLVLRTVSGQPNVTEVLFQYHLQAPLSGHDTIESYLTVIYGRLRERSHGRPLMPNDCMDCAMKPANY